MLVFVKTRSRPDLPVPYHASPKADFEAGFTHGTPVLGMPAGWNLHITVGLGRKWLGRLGGVISSTSEWKRWIGKYRNPKKTNAI